MYVQMYVPVDNGDIARVGCRSLIGHLSALSKSVSDPNVNRCELIGRQHLYTYLLLAGSKEPHLLVQLAVNICDVRYV